MLTAAGPFLSCCLVCDAEGAEEVKPGILGHFLHHHHHHSTQWYRNDKEPLNHHLKSGIECHLCLSKCQTQGTWLSGFLLLIYKAGRAKTQGSVAVTRLGC